MDLKCGAWIRDEKGAWIYEATDGVEESSACSEKYDKPFFVLFFLILQILEIV